MAHGGVSARVRGRVLVGESGVAAAPSAAGRYPNFVNHGGPVIGAPRIFTAFCGASWTADATAKNSASRLEQFLRDLLASEFMNVLSQYGVGTGTYAASTVLAQFPAQPDNAGVQSAIQNAIDAGTIPEPPASNTSDVLILFLDSSIKVDDPGNGLVLCEPSGDTAFGYHDFFTTAKGNAVYYAVIPALDDTCIQESCTGASGCSLSLSDTQEQRRTQVTSHEFAEMTTDPQLNGWYDPQNGENGDICNGETATITAGQNTWQVQKIYSKDDDVRSNGASYCIA